MAKSADQIAEDKAILAYGEALRRDADADPEPFVQACPKHLHEKVRGVLNSTKLTKRALKYGLKK